MKTIKELEKEIKYLKEKVYKKLETRECPEDDYVDELNWEECYDGNLIIPNTELQILKEVLELIDEKINWINSTTNNKSYEFTKRQKAIVSDMTIILLEELKQRITEERGTNNGR